MTTDRINTDAVAAIDRVLADQPDPFAAWIDTSDHARADAEAARLQDELGEARDDRDAARADNRRLTAERDSVTEQLTATVNRADQIRRDLQRELDSQQADNRSLRRANLELTAANARLRQQRDQLTDTLDRATSARIDRDDSVWTPRPDGRWQSRYFEPMTLDRIEAAFGPTRAVLLVDIDDDQATATPTCHATDHDHTTSACLGPTAPVPVAPAQGTPSDGCGTCWACRAANPDDPAARVVRAALDWRVWYGEPRGPSSSAQNDLAAAVDALLAAPGCVDLSAPVAPVQEQAALQDPDAHLGKPAGYEIIATRLYADQRGQLVSGTVVLASAVSDAATLGQAVDELRRAIGPVEQAKG